MDFEEAHTRMKVLAEETFDNYTVFSRYHCDNDFVIEVAYVPYEGYAHKFVYRNMTSPPIYKDLDLPNNAVVEEMAHPDLPRGIGTDICEECNTGNSHFAVVGKLDEVTDYD